MTDVEITRLCAKAMGLVFEVPREFSGQRIFEEMYAAKKSQYNPLHEDAQAMALVKKFGLLCDPQHDGQDFSTDQGWEVSHPSLPEEYLSISPDLNRAICECVAQMWVNN